MKSLRYTVFTLSLLSLAACTQTQLANYFTPIVDIDIPAHVPKLVMQADWSVGSDSLSVMVSKSRGALDTGTYFNPGRIDTVGNAKVELLRDGKVVATMPYYQNGLHYLRGGYKLDTTAGLSYTLRVSCPTLPTVEATQITPKAAKIRSVAFHKDGATKTDPLDIFNGKPKSKIVDEYIIEFDDIPNVENFYSASVIIESVATGQLQRVELGSLDDIAESNMIQDKTFQNKTFSWRLWNQQFKDRKGGGPGGGPNNNITVVSGDKITFFFRSMTADQYLFRKSLDLYRQTNIFSEPVILHTNVKNGYGIFTTQAVTTAKITVP
jgi:predicted DNA-binding protein